LIFGFEVTNSETAGTCDKKYELLAVTVTVTLPETTDPFVSDVIATKRLSFNVFVPSNETR
jgi:hypothetical protein